MEYRLRHTPLVLSIKNLCEAPFHPVASSAVVEEIFHGANSSNCRTTVKNVFVGNSTNRASVHGLNFANYFMHRCRYIILQYLATNIIACWDRTLKCMRLDNSLDLSM